MIFSARKIDDDDDDHDLGLSLRLGSSSSSSSLNKLNNPLGIDVNNSPAGFHEDNTTTVVVSSPNSTVSTTTVSCCKRNSLEGVDDDLEAGIEKCSSRGLISVSDDDDDENNNKSSRKKLRLSKDQSAVLEDSFKLHNTLNPKQKQALAKRLGLMPRQVEVWFQNRRARTKLKQTEVDYEILKRCCEQLKEDNMRLHKEVQELRALKMSPHLYKQMTPPTTLTMCPSCERVAAPPSSNPVQPMPVTRPNVIRHRPMSINPWAAPSVHVRAYEALQPRS